MIKLLGMQALGIVIHSDTPFCSVIKTKYFPDWDLILLIWVPIRCIRGEVFFSAKRLLASGCRWCLGDGLTIKVYYEPWLGDT